MENGSEEEQPVDAQTILDALWTALKENYPAFEFVVGATGDTWRDEFAARLESLHPAPSSLFPVLEELVNRFHDYHTGLHWPGKPQLVLPPVRLGLVEGVIAVVRSDSDDGIAPGDVVLAVDGADALTRYRELRKIARGATPYARSRWACDRLLAGLPDRHVSLTLHGKPDRANLERLAPGSRPATWLESRYLAPDIGYIRIPTWMPAQPDTAVAEFDTVLAAFQHTPYLLIDVRGNGGGADSLADQVTGRFLHAPIVSSISFHRLAGTDDYRKTVEIAHPRGPWRYSGRAAVLTDEGCCSACEHFVSGMKASGDVLLVGRPTTGACGWSKAIPLPGGATLACSLTFPFHGPEPSPLHGITPHLLVHPTLEALRSGRDLDIEHSIAFLRSGAALPDTDLPGRNETGSV